MLEYNKEDLEALHKKKLEELVVFAGSPTHLSKMLGTPLSTVQGWISRGRISKTGATLVGSHSTLNKEFSAISLRPDMQ